MSRITTLLVEDDRGTREALSEALFLGGVDVVGAFSSGEAALANLAHLSPPPQVALVDLGLPGMGGVELIAALRARMPGLAVLVLTVLQQEELVLQAVHAGAQGYLLKDTPLQEVREALEQVRDGLAPLSPEIARYLLARARGASQGVATSALSDREHDVIELLARGHSYAGIARALSLGVGTVQTHVKSIYRKLGVSSKAEATRVAVEAGLVAISRKA